MENLNVSYKEKISSIIKARKEVRIYAARRLPIVTVCEMAVDETDREVLEIIFERLEIRKDTEEVIKVCEKFSKAVDWRVRQIAATIAPISVVCEMAVIEEDDDVLDVIIKRFENAKDKNEVIGAYRKLSKGNWRVRKFVAGIVPIEVVCEMAVTEEDDDVLDVIIKRFENEKDKNEVIDACKKLSVARSRYIREIVAKIAPISVVCQMAITENDNRVLEMILKKLRLEIESKEVKDKYEKLSKAVSTRIRGFVVKIAPITVICEMAVIEENHWIAENIISRLEENIGTAEFALPWNKLAKSHLWIIRNFCCRNMPIEELTNMLENEGDGAILKLIDEMSN